MKYFNNIQTKDLSTPAIMNGQIMIPVREKASNQRNNVYGNVSMAHPPKNEAYFNYSAANLKEVETIWSETETTVSTKHRTQKFTAAFSQDDVPPTPPPPPTQASEPVFELESKEKNFMKLMHRLNFSMIDKSVWRKRYKRNLWAELENDQRMTVMYLTNGSDLKVKVQLSEPINDIRSLNKLLCAEHRNIFMRHRDMMIKSLFLFLASAAGVLIGFNMLKMMIS